MVKAVCQAKGPVSTTKQAIWDQLKGFTRPWHPLVDKETSTKGAYGQQQTVFTMLGSDTQYVEQLSFISHSQHWLGYQLTQGIEAIDDYRAWVEVTDQEIIWQADVYGPEEIAQEVAKGSTQVLQMAVDSLADIAQLEAQAPSPDLPNCHIDTTTIPGQPILSCHTAGLENTSDTLLIFLHGIGGQANNWQPQLQQLGHLLPCVAMDLRGYGASELGDGATTLDDYFADIFRIKAYFGADKLILCGLSYGAWIATSFTAQHPECVQGLIASGGCTGMSQASQEERQTFLQARQKPLNEGLSPQDFALPVVDVIAGPHASEQQKSQLFASMAAIDRATYADAIACFCNPPNKIEFTNIHCPMLLMTGDQDPLASAAEITQLAKQLHAIDNGGPCWLQLEILANCGHVCNLLQPQAYNHHLYQFVRQLHD